MSHYEKHKRCSYFCLILCLICAVTVGIFFDYLAEEPKVPKIEEVFWGNKNDSGIRPFYIKFQNHEIVNLKERLLKSRSTIKLSPNSEFLQKFLDYWVKKYDWKKREAYLNKYPHYKATIQGLDMHFVHVVPETNKTKIPILLLHGFPGTFAEFYDIIPHLIKESEDFSLEVVIPTLPGYLFSDGYSNGKFGGSQHALLLKNLMWSLGFEKFFIFGHDLGSFIATDIAVIFPKNVLGLYSPLCMSLRRISLLKLGLEEFFKLLKGTKSMAVDYFTRILDNGAYYHYQTTMSDILGFSMSDSPMGLASYFLYIFAKGSNENYNLNTWDEGIIKNYDFTNLLDVLSLYWFSKSIPTSIRSYKDFIINSDFTYQIPVNNEVPCFCPKFENEIFHIPDWILRDKYRTLLRKGTKINAGHYVLTEKNKDAKKFLANDIRESIKEMVMYHQNRKRFFIK